jgi:transcriptional regulator with XRE-family HTH domain
VDFEKLVGAVLREARQRRGLTLQDLNRVSNGEFKPSSVAGYERGERSISLARFTQLATTLGVPPDQILAEVMRRLAREPHAEIVIDLDRLPLIETEALDVIVDFLFSIKAQRQDFTSTRLSLRAGDLELLAYANDVDPSFLVHELRPALQQ